MIKINLIAEAPTTAAKAKTKKPEISLGAKQGDTILIICILLFAAIAGGIWYKVNAETKRLEAEQRQKTAERDSLKEFIEKAEKLEAQRERLRRKVEVINKLKEGQQGPVRIMDEASRALPDLVWLEQLSLKGTTLSISGRAMDSNAVANYISNLDASPFFQEPNLTSLTRSEADVYSFQMQCTFTYAPKQIKGEPEDGGGG